MEDKNVEISIVCDKGHVADELRKLADAIEECNEELKQHETYHCAAEIVYPD